MVNKSKITVKVFGIIIGVIVGIILIKCGCTLISAFIAISSESKAKTEYYNQILPNTEIELPYSINDYEAVYLPNWNFESLTYKVQEKKRDADFWIYQNNYDILFCSNEYFYVRKDVDLYSEIETDTVKKIVFADNNQKDESKYSIEPNLSDTQLCQLSKIILSEEYDTKESIEEISTFSDTNDTLIAWYTYLYLKNSENVCYDGIYVRIDNWFCIVEASDSNLYIRDANRNYKLIPKDIAEVIRQEYKQTVDSTVCT